MCGGPGRLSGLPHLLPPAYYLEYLLTQHELAPQIRDTDTVLESFDTWAIIESQQGWRYVAHVGRPEGYPPVEYDIEFERLSENWERQLDEKTWMSDASKADLGRALARAREMAAR